MNSQLNAYQRLLRPKHWIKNAFVWAPIVFVGDFLKPDLVFATLVTFIGFCIAASTVYVFNDICDAEHDRLHPSKVLRRPIAAGQISQRAAGCLAAGLLCLLLLCSWLLPEAFTVIWLYILLNLAYSLKLKHIPILDIFCIAIGFVLRVYAGSMAIHVPLSEWMFITTLCIALYLASIKRQKEFERNLALPKAAQSGRQVLATYTLSLIKRYAEVSAVSSLMFYSFFVITSNPKLILTIPVVIFGIFRYWLVVETGELGESPTDLIWHDRALLVTLLIWLLAVLYVLWPR